jgi:hypothetical protein
MAEFSKEFIEKNKWEMEPDFSIIREFNKLKDGEEISLICEGFGFQKIKKVGASCVLFFGQNEITLSQLLDKN